MRTQYEQACRYVFTILFAQLIFLLLWSLIVRSGPVLVQRGFGGDFQDFYRAAGDWLHGINPYLRPRFDKPPVALLVGLALSWLPLFAAALSFFALNLVIIVWSVRACARKLELSPECVNYLTGIVFLFYPVYYLLERGNLEGLILGCLSWAFCTRNKYLRAVLIALPAALKLYPLLLLAPALRKKQWGFIFATLVTFALLLLPFYHLMVPFLHSMEAFAEYYRRSENISPAAVIIALAGKQFGKWIFMAFWAGTLALMLYRQKQPSEGFPILPFIPWMVAFPALVFPYGGILLLPTLAWKLGDMRNRKTDHRDNLFFFGFLLVGVQAWALTIFFQSGMSSVPKNSTMIELAPQHPIFHWMNSLGMCLILISLALPNLSNIRTVLANHWPNSEKTGSSLIGA